KKAYTAKMMITTLFPTAVHIWAVVWDGTASTRHGTVLATVPGSTMTVKSLKDPRLTIWTWKSNDLNNDPEFLTDAVYSHVNGITYEKRCTLLTLHIADFKTNAFSIPSYSGIIYMLFYRLI